MCSGSWGGWGPAARRGHGPGPPQPSADKTGGAGQGGGAARAAAAKNRQIDGIARGCDQITARLVAVRDRIQDADGTLMLGSAPQARQHLREGRQGRLVGCLKTCPPAGFPSPSKICTTSSMVSPLVADPQVAVPPPLPLELVAVVVQPPPPPPSPSGRLRPHRGRLPAPPGPMGGPPPPPGPTALVGLAPLPPAMKSMQGRRSGQGLPAPMVAPPPPGAPLLAVPWSEVTAYQAAFASVPLPGRARWVPSGLRRWPGWCRSGAAPSPTGVGRTAARHRDIKGGGPAGICPPCSPWTPPHRLRPRCGYGWCRAPRRW